MKTQRLKKQIIFLLTAILFIMTFTMNALAVEFVFIEQFQQKRCQPSSCACKIFRYFLIKNVLKSLKKVKLKM
jgi:hypothetical protein